MDLSENGLGYQNSVEKAGKSGESHQKTGESHQKTVEKLRNSTFSGRNLKGFTYI